MMPNSLLTVRLRTPATLDPHQFLGDDFSIRTRHIDPSRLRPVGPATSSSFASAAVFWTEFLETRAPVVRYA